MPLQEVLNDKNRFSVPGPLVAIADEHKYVLRLMILLEKEANILSEGKPADMECMSHIINYIIHYPDRFHHPKEELIFDRMVGANKQIQDIIKSLRKGHHTVAEMGQNLADEIRAVAKSSSKRKREALAKNVMHYIVGLRDHIKLEETKIFMPALELLSKADWKAIDKEIEPIIDPVFGEAKENEYKTLLTRYLNHAVTISTGAVSPGMIETIAATVERLVYFGNEVRHLPGKLARKTITDHEENIVLLKELFYSRRAGQFIETLTALTENIWKSSTSNISLIKHTFAPPPKQHEKDYVVHASGVSLKEQEDFDKFDKKSSSPGRISWQATLANILLRLSIKQLMAHMGPDAAEHAKKMTFLTNRVPPGTTVENVEFNAFHARWLRPEGAKPTQKTLLYLPGGGFIFPASSGHASIVSSLAEKAQCQGLIVHYRLAPEHPFPAGLEDALSAYRYLLEDKKISPKDIVVAGDSAGGGLTLSLMLAIRDEGLPMPKAICVISPLADLSFSGLSREFNRWRDPMLPTHREMNAFELYSGDTPSDEPLLSPIFGDLSGFPPIFAQVGSTEILLDDTLRVARKARSQGVDVEVEIWDSLPHVWHLWSFMPETDLALDHIAQFFLRHFEKHKPALTVV